MIAISLWQPWASLLVTRQRVCDVYDCARCLAGLHDRFRMVKRFETRSWPCPPKHIGQRVAFHAAKRKPTAEGIQRLTQLGDWWIEADGLGGFAMHHDVGGHDFPLPLGCIVGSGIITASLPIVEPRTVTPADDTISHNGDRLIWWPADQGGIDISDQLPYGDWTPGRYAWQIDDAAPCTERCPWCWGVGHTQRPDNGRDVVCWCGGAGRCDPIPATGHQGFWEWQP